eukprot:1067922-Pelagomonas_calceolata.AAC.2
MPKGKAESDKFCAERKLSELHGTALLCLVWLLHLLLVCIHPSKCNDCTREIASTWVEGTTLAGQDWNAGFKLRMTLPACVGLRYQFRPGYLLSPLLAQTVNDISLLQDVLDGVVLSIKVVPGCSIDHTGSQALHQDQNLAEVALALSRDTKQDSEQPRIKLRASRHACWLWHENWAHFAVQL